MSFPYVLCIQYEAELGVRLQCIYTLYIVHVTNLNDERWNEKDRDAMI